MQQDNTIIQKLQQLDNQQLPDLSQMDAHWQRMEALLVSSTAPQKTSGKAIRWWLPAALLLVATLWLVYRYAQQPPATINTPVAAMATTSPVPGDTLPTAIWATSGDTLKLIQQAPQRPTVRQQGNGGYKNNSDDALNMAPPAKTDTQYFNINFIPCIDSTATDGKTPNLRQQWLNEFFTQLKKEPNRFVIDNRKDTILHCQEGTSLQIPAGSLGGYAGVEFTVTEVYKKSDMVLNQLSATSNKAMLESGGMLRLTASVGGQPVDVAPNNAITVYMADTSSYMQQMQLFTGEKTTERLPSAVMRMNEKLEDEVNGLSSTYMNWIPQYRLFARINTLQEARILELDDNTAKVTQQRKGAKAIFYRSPESKLSKAELRRLLNERYGAIYRTIKVKNYSTRNWLGIRKRYHNGLDIGDSIWVNKGIADKNKWPYTATRKTDILTADIVGIDTIAGAKMGKALRTIDNKYGININRLGWINCDRFSTPSEERTDYVVQLGDSAVNYYTLLVFDNINSLMNGYISGNTVVFPDVPLAMKVTVVSVGINQKGQSVYALQKAVVDKAGLAGLPFQPADAATLPNVLSKLDK